MKRYYLDATGEELTEKEVARIIIHNEKIIKTWAASGNSNILNDLTHVITIKS